MSIALSGTKPNRSTTTHFMIHCNIVLPSTSRSCKWTPSFRFYEQNYGRINFFPLLILFISDLRCFGVYSTAEWTTNCKVTRCVFSPPALALRHFFSGRRSLLNTPFPSTSNLSPYLGMQRHKPADNLTVCFPCLLTAVRQIACLNWMTASGEPGRLGQPSGHALDSRGIGFDSRRDQKRFLCSSSSRRHWSHQCTVQWSRVQGCRNVRLTTYFYSVPKWRMRGDLPPLPHLLS